MNYILISVVNNWKSKVDESLSFTESLIMKYNDTIVGIYNQLFNYM